MTQPHSWCEKRRDPGNEVADDRWSSASLTDNKLDSLQKRTCCFLFWKVELGEALTRVVQFNVL